MTEFYCDADLTTGDNDGSTWANAWQSLADAFAGTNATAPAAGDTCLCRGTDSTTSSPTIIANGDITSGHIKYIGVNSSGVNDGTYFLIDTGTNAINGLTIGACDRTWFENFEIKSTSGAGAGVKCTSAGTDYNNLINIYVHGMSGTGFSLNGDFRYGMLFKCRADGNTGHGIYRPVSSMVLLCSVSNNTSDGISATVVNDYYSCLSYDNGGRGVNWYTTAGVFNCVAHGNTGDNFSGGSGRGAVVACRGTDSDGDNFSGAHGQVLLYSYAQTSVDDDVNGMTQIPLKGSDTNVIGGSDTDYGYEDSSADDYNLDPDEASLFNVAVVL